MKHSAIGSKDPRATEAIRRYSELRQERTDFEDDWEDIARFIRPQRGGFGLDDHTTREREKPLSSVPIIAHGNFAAGIYANITNPASPWGGLTTPDEDLNRWPPFAEWLDKHTRRIFTSFSPSLSSFYPAAFQAYGDLAAFGNSAGYDHFDPGARRFIDVTLSLASVVVDIDFHGRVCEVVRKMRLTPRQAVREFGRDAVPAKVVDLADQNKSEKHTYYQHVLKNDQFRPRMLGPGGKRWLSHHVCEVDETLIRVKGYDDMPFYFPRWDVDSGEIYGTGPGTTALPASRVLQRMEDATIRAAQRAADPTKLAPDRNAVPLNGTFRPGAVVYGAIGLNGQRYVQTEDFNGNIGLTMEEKRAKVEEIQNAFFYAVGQLSGRTGISNEENNVIQQARLREWAPHADRVMEEYASRKFEGRYRHLMRLGQIEPPPQGTPEDAKLEIRYRSAAAAALAADEANAVRQYFADIGPMLQIKPELRHRMSGDDFLEVLHEAQPALPQRLLVPREQAAQLAQAEAQQQQLAQAVQLAQQGGAGLRDLAQAAATGQGGGAQ